MQDKTKLLYGGRERAREEIEGFFKFYKSAIQSNYVPKSSAPAGFKTRIEFYSPKVLAKVLIVQDYIKGIEVRVVSV